MLASKTLEPGQRLQRRQCVACGYDGARLRDGRARYCAQCGCDLRQRPARSYAEMEGLTDTSTRPVVRSGMDTGEFQTSVRHRWVAFLLLALVGLVVTIYLSAAAFSV
jgi:hypothetical protein